MSRRKQAKPRSLKREYKTYRETVLNEIQVFGKKEFHIWESVRFPLSEISI